MTDDGRDTVRDGTNADAPGDARMRGEAGARRDAGVFEQAGAADGEAMARAARRPMVIGIAYLAALLVIGLMVLLIAGGLVRF